MKYVRRAARTKRARGFKVCASCTKRRGNRKYSRPRRPARQRSLDYHVARRANHGYDHRKKFQSSLTFLKHYRPWMKG